MIFENVESGAPIRQGDIFIRLPRCDFSVSDFVILEDATLQTFTPTRLPWTEAVQDATAEFFNSSVRVYPASAIVVSQDCDASRDEVISFCEIVKVKDVHSKAENFKEPKDWAGFVHHYADNPKWLFLPADRSCGLLERSAIDFSSVFQLATEEVTQLIEHRICRLNEYAFQHFREKVSNFFRRYAVDRWYPLTADELKVYREKYGKGEPTKAFPWQNESGD